MTAIPLNTWINGRTADQISVLDRGLQFGDGFFETIWLTGGKIPFWTWHNQRMERSSQRLGMTLDASVIELTIRNAIESLGGGEAVLKLMLTRGTGGRAYNPAGADRTQIIGVLREINRRDTTSGVTMRVCDFRLPVLPALAGIKSLNALPYVIASRELDPTRDFEGLLLNTRDYVVEGTRTNVWFRVDGQWLTPSLDESGVAGVMRAFILEQCRKRRIPVTVDHLTSAIFKQANEVVLTNAVQGVIPVAKITGQNTYSMGQGFRQFENIVAEQVKNASSFVL